MHVDLHLRAPAPRERGELSASLDSLMSISLRCTRTDQLPLLAPKSPTGPAERMALSLLAGASELTRAYKTAPFLSWLRCYVDLA